MMKIVHVVQAYHPAVGGSEWLVKNLSEQLVARHGDAVTVFTTAASRPAYFWRREGRALPVGIEEINGVTVRRFKVFRGLRFLRMLLAHSFHRLKLPFHDWARTIQVGPLVFGLRKAIAESGADLVFATAFPFMHMQYALKGGHQAGIPVVLLGSLHVADKWGYDREMIYNAVRQSDAYIALTTFERDHLIDRGIEPEKIHVVGSGVHIEAFSNVSGNTVRTRFGWGSEPVICAMTRQTVLKRLDVLLDAMPIVWEVCPDAKLLLAGSRTAYSTELDRLIKKLPSSAQENIEVVHDFAEEDKPRLIAACDLLVHPSGYESFGTVIVEAWACGKPVIGARIGAIQSVIDEGENGLLFTFNDPSSLGNAITTLLSSREMAREMGLAGLKKVRANFTWEIISNQIRDVYQAVIDNNGSSRLQG